MSDRLLHTAAVAFQAARRIATLPDGHRARRLHGHGFTARVQAALPPGWAPFDGAETDTLVGALREAVRPLDYEDLNAVLPVPGDAQLADWLAMRLARLGVPGVVGVGVESTPEQGVDLAPAPAAAPGPALAGRPARPAQLELWQRFRFEAAHQLPRVAPGHPCGRMHGHGFEVILHAHAPADARGPLDGAPDYAGLAAAMAPELATLDHACLNDIDGLDNPTSELIAHWLWRRIKPRLPGLTWVTVHETATAGCHHDGERYRIWKERRFESALRLEAAPPGDRRRRLHGHSYRVRLHLTAPLDRVLGWTVDYGDVKALFRGVYERLDHQRLDHLPGLGPPSPARLLGWLREQVAPVLPALDRIDLEQTPGCGAMLCWRPRGQAALPEEVADVDGTRTGALAGGADAPAHRA